MKRMIACVAGLAVAAAVACVAICGGVGAPSAAWAVPGGSEVSGALGGPESSAIPAATYPPKTPAGRPAGDISGNSSTGTAAKPAARTAAELAADRKARELAARELAKTRAAVAARRPNTEFKDTPVKDALQALADAGHFSIVIDPALEEAGVDLTARTVSFKAAGLAYEDALNLVLPREAGYRIESGYIYITTQEKAWLPLQVMVLSMKLATTEIPDFPNSPRFNIGQVAGGGQAGRGGGSLFGVTPGAPAVEKPDRPTPERIIALLKHLVRNADDRRIAPWDDDGGPASIQQLGTQIVVTQTDAGLRAVVRVLAMIE
jgi:hypothetical protein